MRYWYATMPHSHPDARSRSLEALDLNLLNVLYWLLHERSVTVAADRLGLSQPATSRALGRLRDVYGDPLLVKQGRAMEPTPLGERLYPMVAATVHRMREVVGLSGGWDPAIATGAFRVAVKDAFSLTVLRAWQAEVAPEAPHLSLDLTEVSFDTARDLITGKVDLALIPLGPMVDVEAHVDLDAYVLREVGVCDFVLCMRPGHPLAERKVDLATYAAADHILVNPEGADESIIDDILRENGLERRIAYRTPSFLVGLSILRNSDAVMTTSRMLLDTEGTDLLVRPVPFDLAPLSCTLGWHPNWTNDARHRWVRDRLQTGLAGLREMKRAA